MYFAKDGIVIARSPASAAFSAFSKGFRLTTLAREAVNHVGSMHTVVGGHIAGLSNETERVVVPFRCLP